MIDVHVYLYACRSSLNPSRLPLKALGLLRLSFFGPLAGWAMVIVQRVGWLCFWMAVKRFLMGEYGGLGQGLVK
jgi:hypothetical protein